MADSPATASTGAAMSDRTVSPQTTGDGHADDRAFLMALRLSDSFLPVGTYTSSYGVEQYVNEGRLETADELGALAAAYLRRLVGPADLVALGAAHGATAAGPPERVFAADERLHAATLPAEFRTSSTKAGTQLLDLLGDTDEGLFADASLEGVAADYAAAVDAGETPGHYAVVLGVVTRRAGIGRANACHLHAYSFVTELLGAAQRLGSFGHTAIQSQLAVLLPVVEDVCEAYADAPLDTLSSFAPMAEIMGMHHERANRRLFMS